MIINCVCLEPGKKAEKKQICDDSMMLKLELNAFSFEMTYPFPDKRFALVQNEHRVAEGLPFNRAISYCDDGETVREVAMGKALIVKTNENSMISMSDDEAGIYLDKFLFPEKFFVEDGKLNVYKYKPKETREDQDCKIIGEIWEGKYNPQDIPNSEEYAKRKQIFNKALQEMLCILPESMSERFDEVLSSLSAVISHEKRMAYEKGIEFAKEMFYWATQ